MNIALDYDGTYTADPRLWAEFITNCNVRPNYKVYLVTMRYPSECEPHFLEKGMKYIVGYGGITILATSRMAKKPFVEAMGIKIDIWIDDTPEAILMNAAEVWPGKQKPEGQPFDPYDPYRK